MESGSEGANRKHPAYRAMTPLEEEQERSQVKGSNEVAFTSAAVRLAFYVCKTQMRT